MNNLLIVALLTLPVAGAVCAQPVSPETRRATDFRTMVEAERSFSAYTEREGVKAGFSKFLSPEAIVVANGAFVPGKPLYEKAPFLPGVLSWQPVYADIAASGDFGYTTGPFEIRPTSSTEPPIRFGHFTTVWKKNTSGTWEAIADVGVIHARPEMPVTDPVMPSAYPHEGQNHVDTTGCRLELLEAESTMQKIAESRSLWGAYQSALAKHVRLYRAGRLPAIDAEAWTYAGAETAPAIYTLSRVLIAASGDMGIAYGYAECQQKKGPYMRIWKRLPDSSWKIIHEVLDL